MGFWALGAGFRGSGVLGFGGLGFGVWGIGFWGLGFCGLGFWVSRPEGPVVRAQAPTVATYAAEGGGCREAQTFIETLVAGPPAPKAPGPANERAAHWRKPRREGARERALHFCGATVAPQLLSRHW